METKIPELTVFLPTYNEEGNIEGSVLNAENVLVKVAVKWEIIIVNDGSTDKTQQIAENLVARDLSIKLINHHKNLGYGSALKTGFYNAKYKWIAFIDSDKQFDFNEVSKFIAKRRETGADLVIGYYKKRQVSKFKYLTSKMWEAAVYMLFGLHVHDIDCGFKLVSKKVIDTIPRLQSERGAFISSELLIKARNSGFKIEEVPVTHYPRRAGMGTGRDLNVILKSFVDLLRLYRDLRTS